MTRIMNRKAPKYLEDLFKPKQLQKIPLSGQSIKGCGPLRIIPSNKQRLTTTNNPVAHTGKTPRNYGTSSMEYVLEKQISRL